VKNEVKRLVGQLGPNGYIVGPGHVLQADVPPENIVALYETMKDLHQ
jgi:uroporphyrinogen-III decarboxylase